MPLPKLKNSLTVKLTLDSVLWIRELVFQLWQLHQKKYPKTSVKLAQSGCNLAQSVKLRVQHEIIYNNVYFVDRGQNPVAHIFEDRLKQVSNHCASSTNLFELYRFENVSRSNQIYRIGGQVLLTSDGKQSSSKKKNSSMPL